MSSASAGAPEEEPAPSNPLLEDKKDEAEEGLEFSDFFSLRKPKDVKAGVASGVKSIGKGVVGGTASLIAAPIVCASQDGWRGLAKGLAVGVAGAAVLPVVGVAVGAAQITRGLCNTPEAIREGAKGRFWDQVKREWVDEEPMPLATQEQVEGNSRNPFLRGTDIVDAAGYYDALEVPIDAPPDLIKRQYYLLARKYHPDKNLDDPEAHARFQKLGEAYQVLADPQLRKRYDVNGREGVDNTNFMDGVEFFGMIFGCDQFEYLVGELFLATTARSGGDMFDPAMKRLQHERVEKLAINLRALLQRWVQGDYNGFKLAQQAEAQRLAKLSFGKTMLFTIGRVYQNQGEIYEGHIFQSAMARFKQKGESIKSHLQAAQLTVRAFQAQRKISKMEDTPGSGQPSNSSTAKGSNEPDTVGIHADDGINVPKQEPHATKDGPDKQKLEEDTLPLVLEAMWAANVIDIQNTLKKVCRRVLTEGTPESIRSMAQGLIEMGRIFSEVGTPTQDDNIQPSAKQTVEDAMLRVVEKRHQMDEKLYGDSTDI